MSPMNTEQQTAIYLAVVMEQLNQIREDNEVELKALKTDQLWGLLKQIIKTTIDRMTTISKQENGFPQGDQLVLLDCQIIHMLIEHITQMTNSTYSMFSRQNAATTLHTAIAEMKNDTANESIINTLDDADAKVQAQAAEDLEKMVQAQPELLRREQAASV